MTKPDLMAELAADLRTMAGGELPDGDGVTMPVVLWAERWLAKIDTHHAELEAAVRDARGERSESWEVWQDDMCVAGSDSIADAQHYKMMYGQDGPVKMVHVITHRADVIETVPAEQLAAMHNSAREGL